MSLFGNLFSKPVPAMTAGPVLDIPAMRKILGDFGLFGDSAYATASSDWIRAFADDYRNEMFRLGVAKWDKRYDCNHFTTAYVSFAQIKFYAANFQSWTQAQTLAVGELWYRPAWAGGQSHAIVIAVTESGVRYVEPQTQQFVTLTDNEWATRSLVKF